MACCIELILSSECSDFFRALQSMSVFWFKSFFVRFPARRSRWFSNAICQSWAVLDNISRDTQRRAVSLRQLSLLLIWSLMYCRSGFQIAGQRADVKRSQTAAAHWLSSVTTLHLETASPLRRLTAFHTRMPHLDLGQLVPYTGADQGHTSRHNFPQNATPTTSKLFYWACCKTGWPLAAYGYKLYCQCLFYSTLGPFFRDLGGIMRGMLGELSPPYPTGSFQGACKLHQCGPGRSTGRKQIWSLLTLKYGLWW